MKTKEEQLEWLNKKGFEVSEVNAGEWHVKDIFDESGYCKKYLTEEGAIRLSYNELKHLDQEDEDLYPTVYKKSDDPTILGYTLAIIGLIILLVGISFHIKV